MIQASDVQRAYTLPLDGIAQSFQYQQQLAQQQAAQQRALRKEKEAHDLQNVELMQQAFNGLDIGTGTPYDQIGLANVQAGKRQLMDYLKKNPNASYADVYMQATNAARGIRSGIDNAKKVAASIDLAVKRGEQEYPYTDANLARQAMYQQAFYDKDGNVNPNPSPTVDFIGDLYSNPERTLSITNPRALTEMLTKHLDKDLAPVPGMAKGIDDYGVPVDYQYSARTYQEFDPQTTTFQIGRAHA